MFITYLSPPPSQHFPSVSYDSREKVEYSLDFFPLMKGAVNSNYPLIMTASVLALVPTLLLFFFFQRYIIESMAISGVKG